MASLVVFHAFVGGREERTIAPGENKREKLGEILFTTVIRCNCNFQCFLQRVVICIIIGRWRGFSVDLSGKSRVR